MRDINHVVSKQIVEFAKENGVNAVGMEDLNKVRDGMKREIRKMWFILVTGHCA